LKTSEKKIVDKRFLLLLLGFVSPISIQFVGKIYFVEIFFLLVCFNRLFQNVDVRVKINQISGKFIVFCWISIFMGFLGSIMNDISWISIIKGTSLVVFLIIDCIALIVLSKYEVRNVLWWYLGIGLSSIVKYFISPDDYTRASPWKFCFASAVSLLVIILFGSKLSSYKLEITLALLSFLNFYLSFRIEGAALLSTVLIIGYGRRAKSFDSTWIKLFLVGFLMILTVGSLYSFASNAGYLGENLQSKSVIQSNGKYGTLLGGRNEIAFSFLAFTEKPILGWGYYAAPPEKIIDKGLQFLYENKVDTIYQKRTIFELNQIPTHSYLLQFMIFGGFFAGLLWFYLLKILGKGMIEVLRAKKYTATEYLLTYLSLITLWAVFFSPFGAFERLNIASVVALCTIYLTKRKV